MDRFKYTVVSHRGLAHCNPVSPAKIDSLIELLGLTPTATVLDLGCGKAELLLRLVERYGARAVGVDLSVPLLAEARQQAARRDLAGRLTLHEADAATFAAPAAGFDLGLCIGASHIFGGLVPTLDRLREFVRPGGLVLVGEGFWQREPDPAYLQVMGAARDELKTHAENVGAGVALGLVPHYAMVSSPDDWDRYEWLHCRAVELYAEAHPEDPDTPALLERIRAWRDIYLRWGRETLGFGLYLFRRPGTTSS